MRILIASIIVVMSLVFVGCASKHYESALEKDSIYAYDNFLSEYGDSEYANKVRYTRKALIAFQKAEQKNTIDAYNHFLSNYSSSRYEYKAKNKRDLLLQKLDYEEAIENEEDYPYTLSEEDYCLPFHDEPKSIDEPITLDNLPPLPCTVKYKGFLEYYRFKGNSELYDDIERRYEQKKNLIKNKYISTLKRKLKNSNSAIAQAHIMVEYAYDKYQEDMRSDSYLKKFYQSMQNCFIAKRDIILVEEDYDSVGFSILSIDTTKLYTGKVFKGDVIYKNNNYIRTLHKVSSLTNFNRNHNKWLEILKGKEAFGSYSEFKSKLDLSDDDLFSNSFPSKIVEKWIPTKYSKTSSSLGGSIGDFISENPITSLALGAVAYKVVTMPKSSGSSSYSNSSSNSNVYKCYDRCRAKQKACKTSCVGLRGYGDYFNSMTPGGKCENLCSSAKEDCMRTCY